MSDDNRNLNDDRQKRNGDFRMPPRNWMLWIVVMSCVALVFLLQKGIGTPGEEINQAKFNELVDSNIIETATIKFSPQSVWSKKVVGSYFVPVEKAGKED